MCPRSEGFDAAGKKLVAEKSVQELGERARCKHDVGRQTAIECMRHLIEVVADPPQFSEEGRVDLVQRCLRDFDLAVRTQDAQLAERRQFHVGALSGERQSSMIGIRHTDVDLSVASLFQLARHSPSRLASIKKLGSGHSMCPDRKRCRGRAERLTLPSGIC